ncbi:Hydrogen cyanide synthase subunit HcnC precursor [Pseudobythopirellula maris]|uniref:Hydrogen cyanide synthase subunit HcnC n=1 Tax=Pseudobythopirellula maris TaxID=2527991 RepID=A0A5C5ZK46_9BACT|nr:glycine oxidase ThiO [Pseudobythopirellula maris]TWT87742.1 Hydrogen cyanide synthase subunit HcnC precursor [Pseudobythopirellula maris]
MTPASTADAPPTEPTADCLVIGGGVIGLSIAYRLAGDGQRITLLERGETGREASWAGAGILPPGSWYSDHPALAELAEAARVQQPEWSRRLLAETGVDDELHSCGAVYLLPDRLGDDFLDHAHARFDDWSSRGCEVSALHAGDARSIEPALSPEAAGCKARWVAAESQLRNPRRLTALRHACERLGVRIVEQAPVERLKTSGGRIHAAITPRGEFAAERFCLANGAWAAQLAGACGGEPRLRLPVKPIRGQMLLLRQSEPTLRTIVHRGPLYLVPRLDGRVLVGATVEDVGFDKRTTPEATERLRKFAIETVPALAKAEVEAAWSGLRPMGGDGLPIVGAAPGLANCFVAAGHHRSGLQFAPPTADAIAALMAGHEPGSPFEAFTPERFVTVRQ